VDEGVHTSSLVRPVAVEYDQIAPGDFGKARQNVAVGDRAAVPEGRQPVSTLKARGLKTGSQRSQDWKQLCLLPI
jgi:hypothetical protein